MVDAPVDLGAGALAPVVGQQVVDHVVDGDDTEQPPGLVDDRAGDQVVVGEQAWVDG